MRAARPRYLLPRSSGHRGHLSDPWSLLLELSVGFAKPAFAAMSFFSSLLPSGWGPFAPFFPSGSRVRKLLDVSVA